MMMMTMMTMMMMMMMMMMIETCFGLCAQADLSQLETACERLKGFNGFVDETVGRLQVRHSHAWSIIIVVIIIIIINTTSSSSYHHQSCM
jgi:hypothetical protein